MSSPQIVAIEKAEIFPTNQPGSGVYSFRGGYPTVQFQIAKQNKFLDPSTLRLNGKFKLLSPSDSKPTNLNGGAAATNGIAVNHLAGVAGVIDRVTISSQENQTLEQIRSYPRYLASVVGATHSASDLDSVATLGNAAVGSRSFVGAHSCNEQTFFSIPIRSGLLSGGGAIPLGDAGVGGMLLSFELAPDSAAISGYSTFTDAGVETRQIFTPIGVGAYYQLSDLTLTMDMQIPAADYKPPSSGSFVYNSISHFYGILNSSDQTQTYNLGTGKALAAWTNFLPSGQSNSYTYDSLKTDFLRQSDLSEAPLKKVSFLRGGVLFPIDYSLDVEKRTAAESGRPYTLSDAAYLDSI